jgi:hypothetical protein
VKCIKRRYGVKIRQMVEKSKPRNDGVDSETEIRIREKARELGIIGAADESFRNSAMFKLAEWAFLAGVYG